MKPLMTPNEYYNRDRLFERQSSKTNDMEDNFTSTVDGVSGFERMRAGRQVSDLELDATEEYRHTKEEDSEEDEEHDECPNCGVIWDKKELRAQHCLTCGWPDIDEEPECNCSDPGCPCGGVKYGRL